MLDKTGRRCAILANNQRWYIQFPSTATKEKQLESWCRLPKTMNQKIPLAVQLQNT